MVKVVCGGALLVSGRNLSWVQGRSVPGLGNKSSWGKRRAGRCWLASLPTALSVLGGAQVPLHSPSSSAAESGNKASSANRLFSVISSMMSLFRLLLLRSMEGFTSTQEHCSFGKHLNLKMTMLKRRRRSVPRSASQLSR